MAVAREDFEIFKIHRNGQEWYCFKVDYFGVYFARTEAQILKKQEQVRKQVQKKLQWVEQENQKYYARLAAEEEKRALSFKQAKERERMIAIRLEQANMTTQQRRQRAQYIYELLDEGYSIEEIKEKTNATPTVLARILYEANKRPARREKK